MEKESSSRNVSVIKDALGHNVVMINDIIFRGKRGIKWGDVEEYLKQYVGEFYTIAETNEVVYIGTDLPDEYTHSEYTNILKGANEKAKANAAQGLPELINTATNMVHTDNSKTKHKKDAKYGWYRYDVRFALPVYNDKSGEIERYNIYKSVMLVRHAEDDKKYLYDFLSIKKETSSPLES